ncbi:hypothetical protein GPECTOR_2g1025 [Gonium pectorale]|uniref:Uncharacterized protein n=1 Tax=Gonium pectorale TaxID=33097 RepID=A0A150GZY6_GONPE|nr:hypothetical protein GPECTOR_2g1025 [Gonium pectorale]|eukprot:KXZ55476.1 hypothetical protein GPECTOR_2g1025 [Gonium pectorale]
MRAAKERASNGASSLPKPVIAEAEDLKAKFMKIQAEVSAYRALSVENGKLEDEVARLRKENEDLNGSLVAKRAELQLALEAARAEVAGPLQQQLEELSMQLQNSQAQLERLGEAVEAAEADKAAAVKALQEEKEQLLLALAGATRRLADIIYPPGTLPAGLTVTTRLEGEAVSQAASNAAAAASTAVAEREEASSEATSAASAATAEELAAAADGAAATPEPEPAQQPLKVELVSAAASERRRPRGFFGWLLGTVAFWVYQVLGAMLLYYSAAILRGAPPTLNLEFGLGCLIVCTLLPWVNRLLVPRFA